MHCDGRSDVDDSFDTVLVQGPGGEVVVDADTARLCWLAEMLGQPITVIDCPRCGRLHRDDRAAVRQPPLARTCASCGQVARASEPVVANPLADAWERIGLARPGRCIDGMRKPSSPSPASRRERRRPVSWQST